MTEIIKYNNNNLNISIKSFAINHLLSACIWNGSRTFYKMEYTYFTMCKMFVNSFDKCRHAKIAIFKKKYCKNYQNMLMYISDINVRKQIIFS